MKEQQKIEKEIIFPEFMSKPNAPYSPAVVFKDLVFLSGIGPADIKTGKIIKGEVKEEVKATLEKVKYVLEAAGSSIENILKVMVYLSDINNFNAMNEVYKNYFMHDPPARTTIQAGKLPGGIRVEIDVIAFKSPIN